MRCWSSQEHSIKELIAQHTQKYCALFLSCCLLDQHQKTLAGLVIAILVPPTAACTKKQVGQFGILLASTLCYNLFGLDLEFGLEIQNNKRMQNSQIYNSGVPIYDPERYVNEVRIIRPSTMPVLSKCFCQLFHFIKKGSRQLNPFD